MRTQDTEMLPASNFVCEFGECVRPTSPLLVLMGAPDSAGIGISASTATAVAAAAPEARMTLTLNYTKRRVYLADDRPE